MRIQDLQGKQVAVWGLGREGRSMLRILQERLPGLAPTVLNDVPFSGSELEEISALGGAIITTKQPAESLSEFEVVIKSPGVSRYRPEIQRALELGVRFTSATALWFAENGSCNTIGITGSKGKSTTSALTAHLLRAAGKRTALAGNIGEPI